MKRFVFLVCNFVNCEISKYFFDPYLNFNFGFSYCLLPYKRISIIIGANVIKNPLDNEDNKNIIEKIDCFLGFSLKLHRYILLSGSAFFYDKRFIELKKMNTNIFLQFHYGKFLINLGVYVERLYIKNNYLFISCQWYGFKNTSFGPLFKFPRFKIKNFIGG